DISTNNFFAFQLDMSDFFSIRTDITLKTANIFEDSIGKDIDSTLIINELSAFYHNGNNFLSVFAGTFEPFGSDIFLQRHFGINKISSYITENFSSLNNPYIYKYEDIGASYTYKTKSLATSIYIYKYSDTVEETVENDDGTEETEETKRNILNTDLRFTGVFNYFTFDTSFGLYVPFENAADEEDDAIFAIKEIGFHGGLEFLLGSPETISIFTQAGLTNISYSPSDGFGIADDAIYLLFEPRFYDSNCTVAFTLYGLNDKVIENSIFLTDAVGFSTSIVKSNIITKSAAIDLGTVFAGSIPGIYLKTIGDFSDYSSYSNFIFTTFSHIKTKSGIFTIAANIVPTAI
ncbi:MAG: hypothetical protein K6F69_10430, partial [Treponema sp.]|nr:hypothetical protein [Treponema sp.]